MDFKWSLRVAQWANLLGIHTLPQKTCEDFPGNNQIKVTKHILQLQGICYCHQTSNIFLWGVEDEGCCLFLCLFVCFFPFISHLWKQVGLVNKLPWTSCEIEQTFTPRNDFPNITQFPCHETLKSTDITTTNPFLHNYSCKGWGLNSDKIVGCVYQTTKNVFVFFFELKYRKYSLFPTRKESKLPLAFFHHLLWIRHIYIVKR